jgi:hypothetical protein
MPSYDDEVAKRSGTNFSTDDNRRSRYSNDYVRRKVERAEWWMNLLKVAGVIVPLATTLFEIRHLLP